MKNLNLYWSKYLHPSRQPAPTGSKPSEGTPSSAPSAATSSSPEQGSVGRRVNTAQDLFSHLIDLGQYDLAANVLAMEIELKGEDHAWDY